MLMLAKLKKIDLSILLILAILACISTLVIYSAVVGDPKFAGSEKKNVVFYGLGVVVMFATAFFDYRILVKYWFIVYAIGVLLLVAVFFFGSDINGARGWFKLPLVNFQPAELMKLLLILAVAGFMIRKNGEKLGLLRDVIPIGLIVFIPFALVLIQPDLGNAIIYLIILLGMLWIGNVKLTYVLIGTAAVVGSLILFVHLFQTYHDPIKDYLSKHHKEHWMSRIDTYINPEEVDSDSSYQVRKAKIAIGSGGLTGEGYLKGNSVHNRFIPYAYSDSIFVVIGEEFGFIGSSLLLLLYFLLLYRIILIALQTVELSGAYIIIGIVSMFVFQIFEHVGMLMGIMPLTGITLPFISYGGSSLLINMMCIGLVISINIHQEQKSDYDT